MSLIEGQMHPPKYEHNFQFYEGCLKLWCQQRSVAFFATEKSPLRFRSSENLRTHWEHFRIIWRLRSAHCFVELDGHLRRIFLFLNFDVWTLTVRLTFELSSTSSNFSLQTSNFRSPRRRTKAAQNGPSTFWGNKPKRKRGETSSPRAATPECQLGLDRYGASALPSATKWQKCLSLCANALC